MDRASGPPVGQNGSSEGGPTPAPAEPRQRWRIAYARRPATEADRDFAAAWVATLGAAGLPLAGRGPGRSRTPLTLAAPLPLGIAGEHELADLTIVERLPAWRVRQAVAASMPPGCGLVGLDDVWLGEPPLAGAVAGADYRVILESAGDPGPEALAPAVRALLDARTLPRERAKSGRSVAYDLRPLVVAVDLLARSPTTLRIRVRFDPERGAGRPEEVLAALGDALGTPVTAASIVRERLLLASDRNGPEPLDSV